MIFKNLLKNIFLTLLLTLSVESLAQATLTSGERALFEAIEKNNKKEIALFRQLLNDDLQVGLCEEDRPLLSEMIFRTHRNRPILNPSSNTYSIIYKTLKSLTALHTSAWLGHDDFIEAALHLGVDVDTPTETGFTPLFFAVAGKKESTFHLLLEKSATRHKKFPAYSELITAIEHQNLEYISEFKASGKNFDFVLYDGTTPLGLAAHAGFFAGAKLMISLGANVMIQDSKGKTPLHYAAFSDYKHDMVSLLIEYAENTTEYINIQDQFGFTPLHTALMNMQCKNAQFLIKNGAKNLQSRHRGTALEMVFTENRDILKIRQCMGPFLEEFEASSEVVEFRWNNN